MCNSELLSRDIYSFISPAHNLSPGFKSILDWNQVYTSFLHSANFLFHVQYLNKIEETGKKCAKKYNF